MDKEWLTLLLMKVIETIISVKVLTITAVIIISTKLVLLNLMTGGEWGMVNGGVIATVFALREGMKISKIRNERNSDCSEKDNKQRNRKIFI